jgi:hypothetical protein
VEIKAIDPPKSVIDAMEKQMRAEREKRAAVLTAEGLRQSKILTAEGEKQGAILRAEGERQSAILRAEGQAQAIETVFGAIHQANPDPMVMAYQYLQTLPQLAQGEGNTVWMIPSEVTSALKMVSRAFEGAASSPGEGPPAAAPGPAASAPAVGPPAVSPPAVSPPAVGTEPAVLPGPTVTPNGLPAPAGGRQGSEPDGEAEGQ